MNYFCSPNTIMIEVLINPSGGNTVNKTPFNEQQQLLNCPIVAIESFCNSDIAYSPFSSNVPVITPTLFKSAYLELTRLPNAKLSPAPAGTYYKNMPLATLRRIQGTTNPSVFELFRVNPMYIQWPDSSILFPTSVAQDQIYSIPFLIHYLLPNQNPVPFLQNGVNGKTV